MAKVRIFFTYKKGSFVSRAIADFSYYKCVKGLPTGKALWKVITGKRPDMPVFSHVGLIVEIDEKEFIVEIDNKFGINVRYNDLKLQDGARIIRMSPLEIWSTKDRHIAITPPREIKDFWKRLLTLYAEQNRARGIVRFLRYDYGDILHYLVPLIHGTKYANICSEFVYKMVPEFFKKVPTCKCSVPTPNELFYSMMEGVLGKCE